MGTGSSNLARGSTHSTIEELQTAIRDHHRTTYPGKRSTGTKRPTLKRPYFEERCLLQERESNRSKKARAKKQPEEDCKEQNVCAGSLRATLKGGTLHVTKCVDHTCTSDAEYIKGGSKGMSNKVLASKAGMTAKSDPTVSVTTMKGLAAEGSNIHPSKVSYNKAYQVKKHITNERHGLPHM